MIILTADEAANVRGRSPKDRGRAIEPVPLKDGRFMLGEEVLDDPSNTDVREFLASLPREPVEKLPVYSVDDVPPEKPEAAKLVGRTLAQALDRQAILEQKAAIAEEDARAVLKDDAGSVAIEIDAAKA